MSIFIWKKVFCKMHKCSYIGCPVKQMSVWRSRYMNLNDFIKIGRLSAEVIRNGMVFSEEVWLWHSGMAVCFLLFFSVDPLYSVITGVYAGKDVRHLWSLPVISAALFLTGTWIFFQMGEPAFVLYAAVYLALGTAAMLISMFIRTKMQRRIERIYWQFNIWMLWC